MQKINKKIIFIIIIISGMIYGIFNYFTQNKNKENLENISQDIIINNQTENTTEENNNQEKIVIHITGAICNEVIYELEENSRIADAVKMAGGLKEDADLKQINLAYVLEDGMKINIPSKNESTNESRNEASNNTENYIIKENLNLFRQLHSRLSCICRKRPHG